MPRRSDAANSRSCSERCWDHRDTLQEEHYTLQPTRTSLLPTFERQAIQADSELYQRRPEQETGSPSSFLDRQGKSIAEPLGQSSSPNQRCNFAECPGTRFFCFAFTVSLSKLANCVLLTSRVLNGVLMWCGWLLARPAFSQIANFYLLLFFLADRFMHKYQT